jgi:hypothetical protein
MNRNMFQNAKISNACKTILDGKSVSVFSQHHIYLYTSCIHKYYIFLHLDAYKGRRFSVPVLKGAGVKVELLIKRTKLCTRVCAYTYIVYESIYNILFLCTVREVLFVCLSSLSSLLCMCVVRVFIWGKSTLQYFNIFHFVRLLKMMNRLMV